MFKYLVFIFFMLSSAVFADGQGLPTVDDFNKKFKGPVSLLTQELTKISKIKLEVHQLKMDMRRRSEDLGKLVYNHDKDANMVNFTGNSEFFSYIEKIDIIKESI